MRALGLSTQDIELTGIAAAASHLKDVKHKLVQTMPVIRTWDRRLSADLDRSSRVPADAASEPTRPSPNGQGSASRARQDSLGSAGSDPSASRTHLYSPKPNFAAPAKCALALA